MKSKILKQEELEKLASTNSFKLLADLEDKRQKFDKNYIYNEYIDPNPDNGSFNQWRSHAILTESNAVQNETFYKIVVYHPTKQTKILAFNMLGSQDLQELQSSIY